MNREELAGLLLDELLADALWLILAQVWDEGADTRKQDIREGWLNPAEWTKNPYKLAEDD